MSPLERYDAYVAALKREFPRFRIVQKGHSRSQQAIHWILVGLSLGRMRQYLGSFQTTIGQTVYVTDDWDARTPDERYLTLRHEAIHLRQFRRFTLPGMALLYLFALPAGLAYFRARFEKEAYEETIRATAELYGADRPRQPDFRAWIIGQFTGPQYGWMWPFRRHLERWYDSALARAAPTDQEVP